MIAAITAGESTDQPEADRTAGLTLGRSWRLPA
jgi:hypothetical protein